MNTSAVLQKTCEKGALCAAVGLAAGALWMAGAEFLRSRKYKAIELPARLSGNAHLKRNFYALITPGAALTQLNALIAQYDVVLALPGTAPRAERKLALESLKNAFTAYFEASKIKMEYVQSFGRVPAPAKLRNAHAALFLHAHAATGPNAH